MKKVIPLLLVVVFVLAFSSVTFAEVEYESRVVGQKADETHPEGTVARVEFRDYDDGWNLIMPSRGDFEGTSHLADGQIINIWRHEEHPGHVFVYRQVHESHPSYTGEEEAIWDSWEIVRIQGGQYLKSDSGKQ